MKNSLLKIIFLLSVLGMVISGYLIKVHYSENKSICDFNEKFSCSVVNRNEHAEFWGMPVALFGLLGYSLLGGLSWGLYKKEFLKERSGEHFWLNKIILPESLFLFSIIALGISAYLTYTEFFVIGVVCLFCLVSQVNILGISFFSYKCLRRERGERELEGNNILV